MFVASPRNRRRAQIALAGLVMLTLALAAAAVVLILPDDPAQRAKLLHKSVAKLAEQPAGAVALCLGALAVALLQFRYLARARRLERLFVGESGIRYQSPVPAALQALQPGWSLSWSAIGKASLRRSRLVRGGPLAVELALIPAGGGPERVLRPQQWIDPRDMQTPLLGLVERHVAHFDASAGPAGFALERHPRTLAAMAILFALLAYAIADQAIGTEAYAGAPPLGINLVDGLAGALLAWRWLQAGTAAESAGVALLIGCVLAGALYPGLLRINQLTNRDGLAAHPYALAADLSLRPLERELPVLRFPRYADYWAHFAPGSLHEFRLRRGGLGFWQVDMAPVKADMRAWYTSPSRR